MFSSHSSYLTITGYRSRSIFCDSYLYYIWWWWAPSAKEIWKNSMERTGLRIPESLIQMKHLLLSRKLWGVTVSGRLIRNSCWRRYSSGSDWVSEKVTKGIFYTGTGNRYLICSCVWWCHEWPQKMRGMPYVVANFEQKMLANKLFLKKRLFRIARNVRTMVDKHLNDMKEQNEDSVLVGDQSKRRPRSQKPICYDCQPQVIFEETACPN